MIELDINWILPHWLYWSILVFGPLLVMYLVDRSFRRGGAVTGGGDQPSSEIAPGPESTGRVPVHGNLVTRIADRVSGFTGRYVAYWSLIAPFAYSYEVLVR